MNAAQYVYSLQDPLEPDVVRYIGRTNNLDTRLRMRMAEAISGFTLKDVWLNYLRYAGRTATMQIVEEIRADDKTQAELLAKQRERSWIRHFANEERLLNCPAWANHPVRKAVPDGVKKSWAAAHRLLWSIDQDWCDELRLLMHLRESYGAISRSEPGPGGSVRVESMGEIGIASMLPPTPCLYASTIVARCPPKPSYRRSRIVAQLHSGHINLLRHSKDSGTTAPAARVIRGFAKLGDETSRPRTPAGASSLSTVDSATHEERRSSTRLRPSRSAEQCF